MTINYHSFVTKYKHLPQKYESFKSECIKITRELVTHELADVIKERGIDKLSIEISLSSHNDFVYFNFKPWNNVTTDSDLNPCTYIFVYDIKNDELEFSSTNVTENKLKEIYNYNSRRLFL